MNGQSKRARFVIRQLLFLACSALAIFLTVICTYQNLSVTNSSTVAFIFLSLIILTSYFCHISVEIVICVGSALSFNYFYLPPVGTLTINAFSDWIAFFAFLITALFIGYLSASASKRRSELYSIKLHNSKLHKLGTWLLALNDDSFSLSAIAQELVRLFNFEYCSIHVMNDGRWHNMIGQAINGEFQYPGNDLIHSDHSIELNDMIDEFIVDASHVTIKSGSDLFILFTYKKENVDIDFLNALSTVISLRIKDRIN